jgi:hypothetical protein
VFSDSVILILLLLLLLLSIALLKRLLLLRLLPSTTTTTTTTVGGGGAVNSGVERRVRMRAGDRKTDGVVSLKKKTMSMIRCLFNWWAIIDVKLSFCGSVCALIWTYTTPILTPLLLLICSYSSIIVSCRVVSYQGCSSCCRSTRIPLVDSATQTSTRSECAKSETATLYETTEG